VHQIFIVVVTDVETQLDGLYGTQVNSTVMLCDDIMTYLLTAIEYECPQRFANRGIMWSGLAWSIDCHLSNIKLFLPGGGNGIHRHVRSLHTMANSSLLHYNVKAHVPTMHMVGLLTDDIVDRRHSMAGGGECRCHHPFACYVSSPSTAKPPGAT
jgi:hypothetical protein